MRRVWLIAAAFVAVMGAAAGPADAAKRGGLWRVYKDSLKGAKYIDLTHRLTPRIPVWKQHTPDPVPPSA